MTYCYSCNLSLLYKDHQLWHNIKDITNSHLFTIVLNISCLYLIHCSRLGSMNWDCLNMSELLFSDIICLFCFLQNICNSLLKTKISLQQTPLRDMLILFNRRLIIFAKILVDLRINSLVDF